jgi:hypothetical protein
MLSKHKNNLFLVLCILALTVLITARERIRTKTEIAALSINKEALFKPLIMRTLPAAAINVGMCNYTASTNTTTCNVSVSTSTDFLCFLECSHNLTTKETTCLLTDKAK